MELVNLIWLTHGRELNQVIMDVTYDSIDLDEASSCLMGSLLVDDNFNEYSEEQLQAAIAEAVSEYNEHE